MSATKAGGLKTAQKIKIKFGDDYYVKIGRMGGKNGHTGGFYYSMINGLDTHIKAGRKGGRISRRGHSPKRPLFKRLFA